MKQIIIIAAVALIGYFVVTPVVTRVVDEVMG